MVRARVGWFHHGWFHQIDIWSWQRILRHNIKHSQLPLPRPNADRYDTFLLGACRIITGETLPTTEIFLFRGGEAGAIHFQYPFCQVGCTQRSRLSLTKYCLLIAKLFCYGITERGYNEQYGR